MTRVAVVLSGCGVFDGSEIHEAVSVLLHLSHHGAAVQCFAPDIDQAHVVNHLKGQPAEGEFRNVLVEAARIARGNIKPLAELKTDEFDTVVFPGGFGAAKNLCTFAFDGPECTVHAEVERVLKAFHEAEKPIGMCCIAPAIAARVFGTKAGGSGCTVTIGSDADTAKAIETMGSTHSDQPVTDACVDNANRLVTAPAYMFGDAPIHEVHEGIGQMIERTLELAGAGSTA